MKSEKVDAKISLKAKSRKLKTRQDGFTLVELLLYISLAAIMLFGLSVVLGGLLGARVKNQVIHEVNAGGTQVMQIITQTVRNADAIITPTPQSTGSLLTIERNAVQIMFGIQEGMIGMREGNNAPIKLTSSRVVASGLNFDNLSRDNTPGTVRITFTLTHDNPSGRNEYDFSRVFHGSATIR